MPTTMTPAAAPAAAEQLGAEILRALRSNPKRDDWVAYEQAKRQFTAAHPAATPAQYEAFVERLTRQLNL